MKTPEELKQLELDVKKKRDDEWNEQIRKEREEVQNKKKRAIRQATLDIEKAVTHLEWKVRQGMVRYDSGNHPYYIIENYYDNYAKVGELKECYFYDSTSKEYWATLAIEFKKLGYRTVLDETHNEVFDSMTTYETYSLIIRL